MLASRSRAFEIKPALATDWRFAEDNSLDLTIRQGVKFHDGSTLSADDVVYTINMAANPESKVATPSNYAWIDKAEKTGDWTVRIKMKKPTPAALEYLAMVTPIHPKAYREKVGPEGFAAKPVGAGPYKIVKNEQGKEVVLERFDGYWAGSPKGKPAIKTLHVRFVPDLHPTELLAQRTADVEHQPRPDRRQQDATSRQYVRNRCASAISDRAPGCSAAGNLTNQKVRQASGTPSTARTWPTSWCRAAAACRRRPASRRSSAATRCRGEVSFDPAMARRFWPGRLPTASRSSRPTQPTWTAAIRTTCRPSASAPHDPQL
jgi:peptide/nickel transport system substrate-binding protein